MDLLCYRDTNPFTIDGDTIPSIKFTNADIKKDISIEGNIKKNLEFQILDWRNYQSEDDEGNKSFIIRLFGRTRDGKTIYVQVNKFTPYFYVEINKSWRQYQIDALIREIKKKVPKQDVDCLINTNIVEKCKFWGFTNYEKFKFLHLTFTNYDSMKSYANAFKNKIFVSEIDRKKCFKLQLYESNIEPFLRCMHIRKLDAVGWVSIDKDKYNYQENKTTYCDINIETNWTSLNRIEDRSISPFIIASFDIECTSSDGSFPQANRDEDKIIQIGTTFSRLGEDECYYQHIITLGTCDPLYGVDVESYETEQEVLLAWNKLLERTNPDIITGYNIFGFDFEYIKDRSKKLGVYERFSRLSRIIGETTVFKEKALSSSAMGNNLLKYYDMTGRVVVDLMKVIQREHKLESYKLDFVASNFIKEKIKKMETKEINNKLNTLIESDSTYGLKEDQYITVYYNDGITNNKHMDGKKFKIIKLTDKNILVEGLIDNSIMNKGFKVFWCQAKDDVSPKDIFRLQKGTSKDRAIIAKYCIMDCVLCNKLIAKLQILINNIGMANVCHVPLSYIFMRGQGIKIFSLVAKKCREMNHLIPVIIKNFKTKEEEENAKKEDKRFEKFIDKLNKKNDNEDDDNEDDDESSYEGAIVFEPITGVHYEPIPVLDYSSLYPKSMIQRNLSHECYVDNDEKYGYLPGYKYHIIRYTINTIHEPYERTKLKLLIESFKKENKYVIEEVKPTENKIKKYFVIYDKDHTGKKRWLHTEIKVDSTQINIIKYETSKFAEKEDGSKGILPQILNELLDARSKYKNEMENAKNAFQKSVYDGLQLAFKITANSLYGQTGSSFSAICMKQIAASTTSTGREQLIFSKNFIENIYGKLINLALENKQEYLKYCKEIFANVLPKKWNKPNEKNPEEGWTSQEDFQEKFYNKMNNLLENKRVNPVVIYGDSIPGNEVIMLLDPTKNNIEIKKIEDINRCEDTWNEYYNYKNKDANNYFMNILNILLKPNNFNIKFDKHKMVNITQKLLKYNIINDLNKYKKYKIYLNLETDEIYLVIRFTQDKTIICDYDDLDVLISLSDRDNKSNLIDRFYKAIINKLLNKLPIIIRNKIKNLSIDHINNNILDNRKCNLRLISFREQNWKRKLVKTNINMMLNEFDLQRQQLLKNLQQLLIKDQINRYSKEQSLTNYKIYTEKGWCDIKRIIRHKTQKKIFRIITNTSICDVTEDHSLLDIKGNIIKPNDCKIGTELLQSFPKDNFDKTVISHDIPMLISSDKVECMKYYYYSKRLGYNIKVNVDKEQFVLIRTNEQIKNPNKIINIIKLDDIKGDEYVYDIETDNGHFNAGIGELTVKNTDSVFFKSNIMDIQTGEIGRDKTALIQSIQLGIWASNTICLLLPEPQAQLYEKVLWPFMILSKKRYVGNLYEKNPNVFYQKSMGIVLKRRDNAQIVKIVCGGIVDEILNKRNPDGAVQFTKRTLKNILSGKYPMDKFIITKTLRGNALTKEEIIKENLKPKEERSYVDRSKIVHAVLADRMAERDPGNKPLSNDRIPYVYIITDHEVELQGDRVETPDFVIANNLKLDYLFYITNQIQKPATQFLEQIIENPQNIFKKYIMREKNRRSGKKPIISYFTNRDNTEYIDDGINNDNILDLNAEIVHENIKPVKRKRQNKRKIKNISDNTDESETFTLNL